MDIFTINVSKRYYENYSKRKLGPSLRNLKIRNQIAEFIFYEILSGKQKLKPRIFA